MGLNSSPSDGVQFLGGCVLCEQGMYSVQVSKGLGLATSQRASIVLGSLGLT